MAERIRKTYNNLHVRDVSGERHVFIDCSFTDCVFEKNRIREYEFENCRFTNCTLRQLSLSQTRLNDVIFRNCLLQGISFNALTFPHSLSFFDCQLQFVDFINLDLQRTDFIKNAFRECFFEDCNLKKSTFIDSSFSDCEFRRTNLTGCDFSDTEGLDLNHEINTLVGIKMPQSAGNRILQRMKISISGP